MGYLKFLGFVVFFLMSMSSAVAEEIRGEPDACLVTLYNYPAEMPQYSAPKKTLPQSTLVLEKSKRIGKTNENIHSRVSFPSQRPSEQ